MVQSVKSLQSSLLAANFLVLRLSQLRSIIHLILNNVFIVLDLLGNLLFLIKLGIQLTNCTIKVLNVSTSLRKLALQICRLFAFLKVLCLHPIKVDSK